MVERRLLTADIVNSAIPPSSGEQWIADTQVRGLGLRLWSTKSGGQKALCIRVSDTSKKNIRKTFDYQGATSFHIARRFSYRQRSLGECLREARDWAKREIDLAKGGAVFWREVELRRDEDARRRKAAARVKKMLLREAAKGVCNGMRIYGRSQDYITRVDKLFFKYVPLELQKRPLAKVSAKSMARALVSDSIPAGNLRILRSFLGQIFEEASLFYGSFGQFSEALSAEVSRLWETKRDVRFPELREWKRPDYERLFAELEVMEGNWQQAMCIRLFFKFGAPLTKLMGAQWSQFLDGTWYPYWPGQRRYWHPACERIDQEADKLLRQVALLGKRDFGSCCYLFPSRSTSDSSHIKTVATTWARLLQTVGSRYYPIREFARSYREPNNPSYHISFIRQYESVFVDMDSSAEISRRLNGRRYSTVIGPESYLTATVGSEIN